MQRCRTSRISPDGPATSRRANAVLSTVSVVRMAWAACEKWLVSSPSEAANSGMTAISFSAGSGTPMIAGRRRKYLFGAAAKDASRGGAGLARSPQSRFAGRAVCISGIDRNHTDFPPVALRFSLSMSRGAAVTRFDVNAAAALAAASATITAKSGRPLALRPALVAAKRKPRGMNWLEIRSCGDPFNLTGEGLMGEMTTRESSRFSGIERSRRGARRARRLARR